MNNLLTDRLFLCIALTFIFLAVYWILFYLLPLPKKHSVHHDYLVQAKEDYRIIQHMLELSLTQSEIDKVEMRIVRFENYFSNMIPAKELHKMVKKLYEQLFEKCEGTFSLS